MVGRIVSFFESLSLSLHKLGTIVFVSAMIFVITIDVILRYIFKTPLLWGKDADGLLLLIVFFASLSRCWDEKRHVHMEILYNRFKGRLKAFADMIAALTGLLFFGMLGFKSLEDIPYMIATNETKEFLPIPLWPFSAFMALCSFVLFFQLVILAGSSIRQMTSRGGR
jgi:TRAP-type C4-dicarboxylate transport system permease small subunit